MMVRGCMAICLWQSALFGTAAAQVGQPRNIDSLKAKQPAIVQVCSEGDVGHAKDLLRAWKDGALTWSDGVSVWKPENGKDINEVGLQGFTALHMAAHNGDKDIVDLLIQNGADVNKQKGLNKVGFKNEAGWAPMHWAAKNNHAAVVKQLISAGAAVDSRGVAGGWRRRGCEG
jgi:ankyrin repeat protein